MYANRHAADRRALNDLLPRLAPPHPLEARLAALADARSLAHAADRSQATALALAEHQIALALREAGPTRVRTVLEDAVWREVEGVAVSETSTGGTA